MTNFADIIAAISTPPGKGGVAIIRISGEGALSLTEKFFSPASGKKLSDYPPRTAVYGFVLGEGGFKVDDGMATLFKSGASYTGEETVEITSHGGTLVSSMVLECALRAGARLALAGEFTRRAFINGKITLSDAEAIGTLLDAKSREQVALFSEGARRKLNESFEDINGILKETLSSVYARIDYPDEDLGDFTDDEIKARLLTVKEKLLALIGSYKTGRAIKDGVKTVIVGKPNAGKSSLYNAILGEDAAIVTDVKGTTTDVLEREALMDRITLRLFDTAGLRDKESAGVIEKIGIEKTKSTLKEAELVLAVFDLSRPLDGDDEKIINALLALDAKIIAVLNKADDECEEFKKGKISEKFDTVAHFSSISPEKYIPALSEKINAAFTDGSIVCGDSAIISTARQHAVTTGALAFIDSAISALDLGQTADMISSDIERALRTLSEADGREVSEAVTSEIFSKFCVGK